MQRIKNNRRSLCRITSVIKSLAGFVFLAFLGGCSGMKYVPDDKVLYTKSEVKLIPEGRVKAKSKIKELLYSNINPKPNTSIFGIRPGLWFFYVAGNPKKKGLRMFIKNKMGQAPVYMSDIDPDKTTDLLRGHLINNGYFHSSVESKTLVKGKKGKVLFTAHVQRPYRFRNISTPTIDTLFANIDSLKKDSYVKKGRRYNLERLQAEHERLEEALENLGFYYFDDRHLIYEADSTVGERQVDLKLMLEPGVPAKAKKIYTIRNVNVFPDFTLSTDTTEFKNTDTLKVDGFNYIARQDLFRPEAITSVIALRPGKIYRRIDREYSLSHLMTLGAFKFVNIKFMESAADSNMLDANIYMTPFLKKSIRAEFQATSKSNNFVGPGLSVTLTNRNALSGSERLELTLSSGYEVQVGRKQSNPLNSVEIGGEARLVIPRFITPFKKRYPAKKFLPTTEVALGSRIQQRVNYYNLNSVNVAFGYTWKENTLKTHEFYPVDLNFVQLGKVSDDFNTMLDSNPFLKRSFANQFIPGARYSYTVNTQVSERHNEKFRERRFEPSHIYFNGRAEVAGNLVQLLQGKTFQRETASAEQGKIFGSPYSQFAKGEIDFRYYFQMAEDHKIVTRIATGVGYAYGNSVTMPYIEQFAVGGSTSVRAFPARSIGPGTFYYKLDPLEQERVLFIDQRGDIKLEGNIEHRFDLSKTIKTAVFVDAGNIWLINEDTRTGGQFEKEDFIKELAVGTGAGLRFDFNFFVLRFDLAFPVRKPWLPDGHRWVLDDIKLGSSSWRRENLILNIAIGYPF
jgi:outer membrane protein insertion porin family